MIRRNFADGDLFVRVGGGEKVHFYIFTFLQRNTYLNGILNKEGNVKCYIIIIIYYIIIYYNIIYNNFINGFLETLIRRKNPFLCKNVKM